MATTETMATGSTAARSGMGGGVAAAAESAPAAELFQGVVPGTALAVDNFSQRLVHTHLVSTYLLSHFHSDHYQGLKNDWSAGYVVATQTTACLLQLSFPHFNAELIIPIDIGPEFAVLVKGAQGSRDTKVTALPASHCPGSVMFLIQIKDGRTWLHTGDARLDDVGLVHFKAVWQTVEVRTVDCVVLDTTFAQGNPTKEIPSRAESIRMVCELVNMALLRGLKKESRVDVLLTSFQLGYEDIFWEIVTRFDFVLCAGKRRKAQTMIALPQMGERFFVQPGHDASEYPRVLHLCGRSKDRCPCSSVRPFRRIKLSALGLMWASNSAWTKRDFIHRRYPDGEDHVFFNMHSNTAELVRFLRYLKPGTARPHVAVDQEEMQLLCEAAEIRGRPKNSKICLSSAALDSILKAHEMKLTRISLSKEGYNSLKRVALSRGGRTRKRVSVFPEARKTLRKIKCSKRVKS